MMYYHYNVCLEPETKNSVWKPSLPKSKINTFIFHWWWGNRLPGREGVSNSNINAAIVFGPLVLTMGKIFFKIRRGEKLLQRRSKFSCGHTAERHWGVEKKMPMDVIDRKVLPKKTGYVGTQAERDQSLAGPAHQANPPREKNRRNFHIIRM